MGKRENLVTNACTKVLDILGVPWVRLNSGQAWAKKTGGGMRPIAQGKPGFPDIIGVLPDGRFLGVEAKAPEIKGLWRKKPAGKLSELQKAVHKQLIASGALILTVTSSEEMISDLVASGYFPEYAGRTTTPNRADTRSGV